MQFTCMKPPVTGVVVLQWTMRKVHAMLWVRKEGKKRVRYKQGLTIGSDPGRVTQFGSIYFHPECNVYIHMSGVTIIQNHLHNVVLSYIVLYYRMLRFWPLDLQLCHKYKKLCNYVICYVIKSCSICFFPCDYIRCHILEILQWPSQRIFWRAPCQSCVDAVQHSQLTW